MHLHGQLDTLHAVPVSYARVRLAARRALAPSASGAGGAPSAACCWSPPPLASNCALAAASLPNTAYGTAFCATSATPVQAGIDQLDHVTHVWAGRRMNRAVAQAIAGRNVSDIEQTVRHADGVDAHVARHRGNAV